MNQEKTDNQVKSIEEQVKNLAQFFSLLWEIDKRVNPEFYEKRNRSTDTADKA
jgi:hypothetical protein